MSGLVISLCADGAFDRGDGRWQVARDDGFAPRPWALVSRDGSGRSSVLDNYECLDEALAALASSGDGESPARFRVELPCGASFSRPGRVPAEEVMASMGWVYVRNFKGYKPLSFAAGSCPKAVRAAFRDSLPRGAMLGQATVAGTDGATEAWCADVFVAHEGFVRFADIGSEAGAAFARVGADVVPGSFDFVAGTPAAGRGAEVVEFKSLRAARERPAA